MVLRKPLEMKTRESLIMASPNHLEDDPCLDIIEHGKDLLKCCHDDTNLDSDVNSCCIRKKHEDDVHLKDISDHKNGLLKRFFANDKLDCDDTDKSVCLDEQGQGDLYGNHDNDDSGTHQCASEDELDLPDDDPCSQGKGCHSDGCEDNCDSRDRIKSKSSRRRYQSDSNLCQSEAESDEDYFRVTEDGFHGNQTETVDDNHQSDGNSVDGFHGNQTEDYAYHSDGNSASGFHGNQREDDTYQSDGDLVDGFHGDQIETEEDTYQSDGNLVDGFHGDRTETEEDTYQSDGNSVDDFLGDHRSQDGCYGESDSCRSTEDVTISNVFEVIHCVFVCIN